MKAADFRQCDGCHCFAARRAARAITQTYDQHLRPSGLRATQFTLLAFLIAAGPASMNRVADYLGADRTTLTRNLRPLLRSGYVAIEPGKDRRVRTITVTAEGRRAAERAFPMWRRAQEESGRSETPSMAAEK
jgi:DNA-binding MarR family transcriptional regulator